MQFTTAKKRIKTINQAEKLTSDMQIQMDESNYNLLKAEKLLLISHLIDFHPCILKHLIPLFISESAIDFLIKNHVEIKRRFSVSDLVEYGRIYKHVAICGLKPNNLTELKRLNLLIKPAQNDKSIS